MRSFILGHHDKAIAAWLRRIPWPVMLLSMVFGAGLLGIVLISIRQGLACLIDYGPALQRLRVANAKAKRQANRIRDLELEVQILEARLATRYRPCDF
jgi:hypothetical protein